MKILIVSATQQEIQPLLDVMKDKTRAEAGLFSGTLGIHQLNVLISGVGMVATAFHCGKVITGEYDLAINAGICGSFNRNLDIGTVVNVIEDRIAELGAEDGEIFLSLEELELPGTSLLVNTRSAFNNQVIHELPKVNAITVNTTHGNEESIARAYGRWHPYVESMEGAAFMFACELSQLPYIQLRSVSNYVERRNRNNWDIPLAIRNLNEKLITILYEYR